MLRVMDQGWRHVLRGFLSAFSLVPTRPVMQVRVERRRKDEFDGPFVKVGGYLRTALGRVRDEAGESGKPGQQPPR